MDAGQKKGRQVTSKAFLEEVRQLQLDAANTSWMRCLGHVRFHGG